MTEVWTDINKKQPEEGEKVLVFIPELCSSETWHYGAHVMHQLMANRALWISLPIPTDEQIKEARA